jgi:CheY-like chemotaxis protein
MRDANLLFVEDDLVQGMDVSATLEAEGFRVTNVSSHAEAIEALSRDQDLGALLTDIDLGPGPDGFDVARQARRLRPGLPVVFVSGSMGIYHAARRLPGSIFVAKPFHPAQIIQALNEVIRHEAA